MELLQGLDDNSQVAIVGAGNYFIGDWPAEKKREIRASVDITLIENLH